MWEMTLPFMPELLVRVSLTKGSGTIPACVHVSESAHVCLLPWGLHSVSISGLGLKDRVASLNPNRT